MSGRVLIAGIGNIFLGDDGFGPEVARRLGGQKLPDGVCVKDFGIRGFDLACALTEPWELIVMVDAAARGGEPGTIYVLEVTDSSGTHAADLPNAHGLDPAQALRLAGSLGKVTARLLLVACEPAELGGDEGQMGLSEPAERAVAAAIAELERIAYEFTQGVQV